MSQEENKDNKQSGAGLRLPLGRSEFGNVQIPPSLMPPGYLPHPNQSQLPQLKYGQPQRPNYIQQNPTQEPLHLYPLNQMHQGSGFLPQQGVTQFILAPQDQQPRDLKLEEAHPGFTDQYPHIIQKPETQPDKKALQQTQGRQEVPSLLPPDMTASTPMVYQNVNIIQEDFMIEQFMKELDVKFADVVEDIMRTDEKSLEERFKYHELPLARIKKIMKSDQDVRMISAEAPVIFSKACLMFVLELTYRSWYHVATNKRRTLQKCDISQAVANTDIFDFLQDVVPREPQPNVQSMNPVSAPPSSNYVLNQPDQRFLFNSQSQSYAPPPLGLAPSSQISLEENFKSIQIPLDGDLLEEPRKDDYPKPNP